MEIDFYWCNKENSDKVWGFFHSSDTIYNFWGKRGTQLAFQQHPIGKLKSFQTKAKSKISKGYKLVDKEQINDVWPNFFMELDLQFMTAMMSENFRYQPNTD